MRFPRRFAASIARADFMRQLPQAVDDAFVVEGDTVHGASGWHIALAPLPPLAVGGLRLERWQVSIDFDDWPEAASAAFMHRFSLYFQRGGG